jgi:C1A family cysteine protease
VCSDTKIAGVPESVRNYGCDGGNTETAFMYVAYTGGLRSDANYPYTSFKGSCGTCLEMTDEDQYIVTIDEYYSIDGEESMKDYMLSTGPLSVCLNADNWASYESGVLSVCGTEQNHCVQVVGVNTEDGYWIVRNSWGTTWGQEGYIYLKYGQDTCGITTNPTYTKPRKV